jgi:hypothetical protein
MTVNRVYCVICALCCLLVSMAAPAVMAQDASQSQRAAAERAREDQTNFDTELYLVRASSSPRDGEEQLPALLQPVVKQLRATLPFKNYSLAATLLNRVGNNGNLSLSWVGGPLTAQPTSLANLPSLSEFIIGRVHVLEGFEGTQVQLQHLTFGARIPIQTGTNIASSGTNSAPVWAYEHTGITTDITVRVDQPAVVGTLNVGPSGDALIVIISARRVQK